MPHLTKARPLTGVLALAGARNTLLLYTGIADTCAPSRDSPTGPLHGSSTYVDPLLDGWIRTGTRSSVPTTWDSAPPVTAAAPDATAFIKSVLG